MWGSNSCFSFISLYRSFLRRSVTAAGLCSQTLSIDDDGTIIHFWGPPSAAPAKPTLVLIHGFGPAGIWQWRPQVTFFAKKFNVFVPDLVFFGESFTNSPERSEIFQAACVAKLLKKLGIPRYSVVGTSYGGFVAYRMAAMWPENVERLVIASSAVNMRRSDNEKLLIRANAERIEDLLLPLTPCQMRASFGLVVHRLPYIPDFFMNDLIEKLYRDMRKEKIELIEGLSFGIDETVNISPVSQDVLIVWGEHDNIFLLEKAAELAKLLGDKATVQVINNTSHVPQLEHPKEFNRILLNFLLDQP